MSPEKNNINNIIKEYQLPLIDKLKIYKKKRKLAWLCKTKLKGLTPSRLSDFMSGNRNVSPFYLWQFLRAGFITIPELLDGKPLSDIPPGDRLLLGLLSLNFKTTNSLVELRDDEKVDIEKILELLLGAVKKGVDVEKLLEEAIAKKL